MVFPQRHTYKRILRLILSYLGVPFLTVACAAAPHGEAGSAALKPSPLPPAKSRATNDSRAAYHFMLGYQAELAQDTEQAIREYEAALETDSSSHFIKGRLAVLYFSMGDVNAALRYAEDVTKGDDLDAQLLTQMAGVYAGAGQLERALMLFDRSIQADPTKSDPYFAKGLLFLNLKRFSEAERAMQDGLKTAPDSAVGLYYLGRVAIEAKRFDEAVKYFERAISSNPSFDPAYLSLASLYESQQEREKAIAVYQRYLQGINPRNREVRQHLVRLYISGKDYEVALKELEQMLAEDPTDLDAQLRVSLIYGELKEYHKAIERLTTILTARPAELKIRDYLGYLYEEVKEPNKAIDAYEFNLKLEPTFFESHLHLGVLFYRQKRLPEAIAHLQAASNINPKQPESFIVLGLAHLQGDQFEQAYRTFEEGIRHNPKSADLHFNAGTAYDKLDRFDDVVRAMETAIKLDPHHADALNYLGYSYAERGIKIEEALSLTKQAVALKPNNGYYVDSLGWVFFKKGLLKEALEEIKRAASLVGDDPVIYEHLGEIYFYQERVHDAREAWVRSLELDPSNAKLMERFRSVGMGDPIQEERIRQAQQKALSHKISQ